MLTPINLLILLLIGAFLVPVLKQLFKSDYAAYVRVAFVLTVLIFFFLNLPRYANCTIFLSLWVVLTFPLRPLGLCIVILLVIFLEGSKKLEDDKEGKKAQASRKTMTDRIMVLLVILVLSSTPAAAEWLADRTGQDIHIITVSRFARYVPSLQGLSATTRIVEDLLHPLFHPFKLCARRYAPLGSLPQKPDFLEIVIEPHKRQNPNVNV